MLVPRLKSFFSTCEFDKKVVDSCLKTSVFKLVTITYLFAIGYVAYGFISYDLVSFFSGDVLGIGGVTLFENIWPRFVFNSLPTLLLIPMLKSSKISNSTKLTLWFAGSCLIYHSACWIHILPTAMNGQIEILLHVNAVNQWMFCVLYCVLALPAYMVFRLALLHLIVLLAPFVILSSYGESVLGFIGSTLVRDILMFWVFDIFIGILFGRIVLHLRQAEHVEANKTTRLLRTLLHDISNPLYTSFNSLKRLKRDIRDGNMRVYDRTCQNMDSIMKIINDIRKMEGARARKLSIHLESIDFVDCFMETRTCFFDVLKKKRISLNLIDNLQPGTCLKAEKVSFVISVLNNVVSNAIKFSFPGQKIDIIARESGEMVLIDIRDYGVGMPKELIPIVFDPSEKTSHIGTMGEVGTGFGMPLVKSYVEFYGGSIKIESKHRDTNPDDHGTTVRIQLLKGTADLSLSSLKLLKGGIETGQNELIH